MQFNGAQSSIRYDILEFPMTISINYLCFITRFDIATNLWKATSTKHPDFLATSEAPYVTMLIGTHSWTVYNDSTSCSPLTMYKR